MGRTRLTFIAGASIGAACAAAAIGFQDNISQFLMNPRTPFQTMSPPPKPEYGARGAWALWPLKGFGEADVFYIHSTTYYSPNSWNAAIADPDAESDLKRDVLPNEAGPFLGIGAVYGPRYRQATLYSFFTQKYDGIAARKLAREDVKEAFKTFLADTDGKRPLIIVGYGQGGLHGIGLLADIFQDDEALRRRLAVAYAIDQPVPTAAFKTILAKTPPCRSAAAARCVVSFVDFEKRFDEEMERARRRSMIWSEGAELVPGEPPILCINPLSWTATHDYVDAEAHVGAASATGLPLGSPPPALPRAVGARCVDGVLVVDEPDEQFLRRKAAFGEKWRAQSFNLFYFDLAADARRRVRTVARLLDEEYRRLEPIADSVELQDSPIHKAPN